MVAPEIMQVLALAISVTPGVGGEVEAARLPPIDHRGVPIYTAKPIRSSGADRSSVTIYDGILGVLPGYILTPSLTSGYVGIQDYGTTLSVPPLTLPYRHPLVAMSRFVFHGTVGAPGQILYFDFYQNDFTPVSSFGVVFGSTTVPYEITGLSPQSIPTEGVLAVRANDDAAVGPVSEGSWDLDDYGVVIGIADDYFSPYPGYSYMFALDQEDAVPSCPPSGPPFTLNTYQVVGTANDTAWSWSLTPSPDTSWVNPIDTHVPGVPVGGTALDVCQAFADSINAWAALQACGASSLQAMAVAGSPDELRIRVGSAVAGGSPFDLYIGDPDTLPDQMVAVGTPVTFNPTIERADLSGRDCNGNFQDDEVDIATGMSPDINGNGIPDECESPPPMCPGDLNGDNRTDIFDFGVFATNFGATGLPPYTGGDFNGDGAVTVLDFGFFATNFGCVGAPLP